jgi:hypothetical protein
MSLADIRLLARWCPACRWREPGLRRLSGTGEGVPGYGPFRRVAGESCRATGLGLYAVASEYPLPGAPADRLVVALRLL